MKNKSSYLAIILAAGKGTRLDSKVPKPLHKVNNLPIIDYLINAFSFFSNIKILTVVGHQKDKLIEHIGDRSFYVVQQDQNGTGGAVKASLDFIKKYQNVFVFVGDSPFVHKNYIEKMMLSHQETDADCSFLYSEYPFDLPYARLFFDKNKNLEKLIEFCDLNNKNKDISSFFTSHYLFKSQFLLNQIDNLELNSVTGECNLTEIINICIENKNVINPILIKEFWNLMGINTLDDIKRINLYKNYDKKN